MLLTAAVLTVSLAASSATPPPPGADGTPGAVDLRPVPAPSGPALALLGSGDGEPHHHDDGDHMTTMWIVMGAMMAVMMVGVGVYMMRNNASHPTLATPGSALAPSPAAAAIPPPRTPGG